MKFIIYIGLFFLTCFSQAFADLDSSIASLNIGLNNNAEKNLKEGSAYDGGGYSTDRQEIVPTSCFNTKFKAQYDQQGEFTFNNYKTFDDLQSILEVDVSANGKVGAFSAESHAKYLRSIDEKDYSLSINYYQYVQDEVLLTQPGIGINEALTPYGQDVYQNNFEKFGLMCGDEYITGYHQGALLVGSLYINFQSSEQKKKFDAEVKASWGNIAQASAEISKIANENHINGYVTFQAYQKGGDPRQLADVFKKGPEGGYYATECDIKDMAKCSGIADGLIDYARNLKNQVSFTEPTTLVTFSIKKDSIKNIGLKVPDSFVPGGGDVERTRGDLFNEYKRYDYYEGKLTKLLNYYPVAWDQYSNVYKKATQFKDQAHRNVVTILSPSDPDQGAYGCFKKPDECLKIADSIKHKIEPITDDDLNFLDGIKYIMSLGDVGAFDLDAIFYKKGDADDVWVCATPNEEIFYFNLNDTKMSFYINDKGSKHHCPIYYDGSSTDKLNYIGVLNHHWGRRHKNPCGHYQDIKKDFKFSKQLSPFYFAGSPILTSFSKSGQKNSDITFSKTDFADNFMGHTFDRIEIITLPSPGKLKLSNNAVVLHQEIAANDLNNLTYTPKEGYTGTDSFKWNGSNGEKYSLLPVDVGITISDEDADAEKNSWWSPGKIAAVVSAIGGVSIIGGLATWEIHRCKQQGEGCFKRKVGEETPMEALLGNEEIANEEHILLSNIRRMSKKVESDIDKMDSEERRER